MASTDPINGTNLLVYVGAEPIAGAKSCKLSVTHDPRDATTKDSLGWAVKKEGLRNWSLTCDGLATFGSNYNFNDLVAIITTRTAVTLKFATTVSGDTYWTGTGYLKSIDLDAAVEDSIAYSAAFDGNGALTTGTV